MLGSHLLDPRHPRTSSGLLQFDATGSQVSISLALTFRTRGTTRRIQAYQVNHLLRRLRLAPCPIGELPFLDDVKGRAYGTLRGAKNLILRAQR